MKSGRLFCDGGARGNPGPAGCGAVLYDGEGCVLDQRGEYLGRATNNTAEYRGLLLGLELARAHGVEAVEIYLDSELVVRQINGQYRVRHPEMKVLWDETLRGLRGFARWQVEHVRRENNAAADRLVNEAIDCGLNGG